MLEIDRLSLHLPAGFEHRGSSIARLVAERLGAMDGLPARHLDSLSLPSIKAAPNATDHDIAGQVANGIAAELRGSPQQGVKGAAKWV